MGTLSTFVRRVASGTVRVFRNGIFLLIAGSFAGGVDAMAYLTGVWHDGVKVALIEAALIMSIVGLWKLQRTEALLQIREERDQTYRTVLSALDELRQQVSESPTPVETDYWSRLNED